MILISAPIGSPLLVLFLFHLLVLSLAAEYPNQVEKGDDYHSIEAMSNKKSGPRFYMMNKDELPLVGNVALWKAPLAVEGDIRLATDEEVEINRFYTKISASFYSLRVSVQGEYNCDICDPRIKFIKKLVSSPIYDVNAMILRSDSLKTIYVVFRGAISPQNNALDFQFVLVDYPYVKGAKVQNGFFNGYQSARDELLKALDEQVRAFSDYKIAVTGHSFGAAEALLCVLDLYRLGDPYTIDKLYLYNQGQPRVGNDVFARYVVSTKIPYQRLVNEHDLTTHSPPQVSALGVYMHAGQEIWTNNGVTYVCTNGLETDKCSNTVTSLSMTDHGTYLGVEFAIVRP